jgi:hypothetical protein
MRHNRIDFRFLLRHIYWVKSIITGELDMAHIGYARVSSFDQDHATQVARLKAAGCEVIRNEKASGKTRAGRDELAAILDFIGPVTNWW